MIALKKTDEWTRSSCPICGRGYPHKRGYKPVTCGRYDCLHEANQRGMLPGKEGK